MPPPTTPQRRVLAENTATERGPQATFSQTTVSSKVVSGNVSAVIPYQDFAVSISSDGGISVVCLVLSPPASYYY